jgi:hypothetical protein
MPYPSWQIPEWQRKRMTPEAIARAEALVKFGLEAQQQLIDARLDAENAQAKVNALLWELEEKYRALQQACTTYVHP